MTLEYQQEQEPPQLQAPPGPPPPPPDQPPVDQSNPPPVQPALPPVTPKTPAELAAIKADYIPLEPENPDSESSTNLIKNYNDYRLNGGQDKDLAYEDMQNILAVAKGQTMHTDKMEVLTNPQLYRTQVYDAGKAPAMLDDVINDAIAHPEHIGGDLANGVSMAKQFLTAGALGIGDIIKDGFTSLNPWASQSDRDAATARNVNGILRGVKGGMSMFPDLVAALQGKWDPATSPGTLLTGLKETYQYDDLKSKLDQTTDPAQREQLNSQLSEIMRQGELRAALNEKSVDNAHNDAKAILNATGISAALNGLGLPDRLKMLGTDEAKPTPNQQMVLGLINPIDLVTGGLGEAAGVIKSGIRFGDYEKAVTALKDAEKIDSSLTASRFATESAINASTDDAAKAGYQAELANIAAQEKAHAPVLAKAQSDASTLQASITKQLNEQVPSLSQSGVKLGTGMLAGAIDSVANLVENAQKVPSAIMTRILGPNAPQAAIDGGVKLLSSMKSKAIDMAGISHFGGPAGYIGGEIVNSLVDLLGNPDALRGIARDTRVIGNDYALGRSTLPALQEMDGKLSGMGTAVASFLDNPTIRSIPRTFAGGLQGAVTGGVMGSLASGGTAAGFGQGFMQGGLFGAAGAGHGQVKSFNSPGELRVAQIGDRARFVDTLDPAQRPAFNKLPPDMQLMIGTYAHAHPDLNVSFIHDPTTAQGRYYVEDTGGHAIINTAATNPLDSVLVHEISHHIADHGLQDTINDNILGNPATGHIGLFTHLDEDGKPVVETSTHPVSGAETASYLPNDDFNKIKSDYNARKLRDLPGSQPEDNYGIAQEINAELQASLFTDPKATQKLIRGGALPSDLVNSSAIGNFLFKLGLPSDSRTGSLMADPEMVKNVKGLADITGKYYQTKRYKNHPLEHEDGYSRVTPDMWHQNPDILIRNLDGAGILKTDPKTGNVERDLAGRPVILSQKQADTNHAQFTGEVMKIIRANPRLLDATPSGDGLKLVTDRDGHQVYRGRNVPDEIFAKMAETNQYNPSQIKNWRTANELTRRNQGAVMDANYNTARGAGGKYATVEMKNRALVPMYTEISPKTGQVNILSYDPGQMQQNAIKMLRRPEAAKLWGSLGDAINDIHTYLGNIKDLRPGETDIGMQKKQVINAMFGIRGGANPYIETLSKQIPSVFKTFRIDRINKAVEVAGANRPINAQTYENVRSFLLPRAQAAQEAAVSAP